MKILFVCDGNICRSPAAPAFWGSNSENGSMKFAQLVFLHQKAMVQQMQQVLAECGLPVDLELLKLHRLEIVK